MKLDSARGRSRLRLALRLFILATLCTPASAAAQEPVEWGVAPLFHTFSIAAVDPATGESGVAVTTRVPCVGNGVPWVRAGVGAVATQASTRTEYGSEILDLLASGLTADEALTRAVAGDAERERRQVGVASVDGTTAHHTGNGTNPWAGHRSGPNYTTQGNLLVGAVVLEAVARSFEASEGSGRHLADRLIEALAAGQAAGGDARKGRLQSAAVIVADPRPGRSRRADGVTANINVCEHPTPVGEVRRIYDAISQTLGYRRLEQFRGSDVWQLKVMLHALGYYRAGTPLERDADSQVYDAQAIDSVERFRGDHGLSTARIGSPRGLVDGALVELLWRELEDRGLAEAVRSDLRDLLQVRR